jgi:hypothetical protein
MAADLELFLCKVFFPYHQYRLSGLYLANHLETESIEATGCLASGSQVQTNSGFDGVE